MIRHPDNSLIGLRYGRWVITGYAGRVGELNYYNCLCDCGKSESVNIATLRNGGSQSCGCLRRDNVIKAHKKPASVSASNKLYDSYMRDAVKRGLRFNLSKDDFLNLTASPCHYCGMPPNRDYKSGNDTYLSNGIDRVDNTIGYEPGNVVSACKVCNRAKNTMSYTDFNAWLDNLCNFRGKQ